MSLCKDDSRNLTMYDLIKLSFKNVICSQTYVNSSTVIPLMLPASVILLSRSIVPLVRTKSILVHGPKLVVRYFESMAFLSKELKIETRCKKSWPHGRHP